MNKAHNDRLGQLLGPFDLLLTAKGTILFCTLGWLVTCLGSSFHLGSAYIWTGILLLLFSIQIERPWLNYFPFPPLTTLVFTLSLRWVVGGMLLEVSEPLGPSDVIAAHITDALPLSLIPCACIVIAGGSLNRKFIQNQSYTIFSRSTSANLARRKNTILIITLITGIIAVGYILIGTVSGTLDRGAGYMQWVGKFWRPDTLFSAVIRLRDIFFVILPTCIVLLSKNKFASFLLCTASLSTLLLSMILGGRGLLIYPLILLLGGLWLAKINARAMRIIAISLVAFGLLFIVSVGQARSNAEFRSSSALNPLQRISSIIEASKNVGSSIENKTIRNLGYALYTHSDPYLFTQKSISTLPAGSKGLENLKYLWVPRIFNVNRPEINDGHLIANQIRGDGAKTIHDGRYYTFNNVSFGADLFWRFRWAGVITGSIIFGIIYATMSRAWYVNANISGRPLSILIALFPATFLQGPPIRSVSETAWNWFYEIPKYMIVFLIICLLIQLLEKKFSNNNQL